MVYCYVQQRYLRKHLKIGRIDNFSEGVENKASKLKIQIFFIWFNNIFHPLTEHIHGAGRNNILMRNEKKKILPWHQDSPALHRLPVSMKPHRLTRCFHSLGTTQGSCTSWLALQLCCFPSSGKQALGLVTPNKPCFVLFGDLHVSLLCK